jgi:hypothetical protein
MATTTNYGWTTPDNTALVKDGASAIRTLGSSVDTTVKALSPGTTTGDVDYYTSSTAKARLGIGTTGQVLTVAAGVPSWATISAGGMTLLSTTTLSGATVTISSISSSYKRLVAYIYGVTNATADGRFEIKPNNTANIVQQINNAGGGAGNQIQSTNINLANSDTGNGEVPLRTSTGNFWCLNIENYASSASNKSFNSYGAFVTSNSNPAYRPWLSNGAINTTTAISSLVFSNTGGNLSTGTVLLYGVN